MLQRVVMIISLISFLSLGVFGQAPSRVYWKEIANKSALIVVGMAEEDYRIIRPEKFKQNPDGSFPNKHEIYVGRVFRVKVTKKLKGKIKTEKNEDNKYINVFTYWATGTPSLSDPRIFTGEEYILFLEPNNDKELDGKEIVDFKADEVIRRPFDNKSSYVVVQGFRGTVPTNNEKDKLIKEIKKAID